MSDPIVVEDELRPITKCGTCGQSDNAPKLQVQMSPFTTQDGLQLFHPHDFEQNASIYYHMDCPSEWHDLVISSGNDQHAKHVELAKSGVQNDALHAAIKSGV